jgi:hypothetical protein
MCRFSQVARANHSDGRRIVPRKVQAGRTCRKDYGRQPISGARHVDLVLSAGAECEEQNGHGIVDMLSQHIPGFSMAFE